MFCSRRFCGDLNILSNLFCFVNTLFYFFNLYFHMDLRSFLLPVVTPLQKRTEKEGFEPSRRY